MKRADRMARSKAARQRRRSLREIVVERTLSYYSKMRRLRKKKK